MFDEIQEGQVWKIDSELCIRYYLVYRIKREAELIFGYILYSNDLELDHETWSKSELEIYNSLYKWTRVS